jgi:aminopeptidase-like protein
MGGQKGGSWEMALFWNLNLADGEHGVLDVAERSGISVSEVAEAASALVGAGLLTEAGEPQ